MCESTTLCWDISEVGKPGGKQWAQPQAQRFSRFERRPLAPSKALCGDEAPLQRLVLVLGWQHSGSWESCGTFRRCRLSEGSRLLLVLGLSGTLPLPSCLYFLSTTVWTASSPHFPTAMMFFTKHIQKCIPTLSRSWIKKFAVNVEKCFCFQGISLTQLLWTTFLAL